MLQCRSGNAAGAAHSVAEAVSRQLPKLGQASDRAGRLVVFPAIRECREPGERFQFLLPVTADTAPGNWQFSGRLLEETASRQDGRQSAIPTLRPRLSPFPAEASN